MIWSVEDSIYTHQKSAKIACVHALKMQEHFYPGVTQVCSLGFSQMKYDHVGERPHLLSHFLGCLWNEIRINETINFWVHLSSYGEAGDTTSRIWNM